jgi:hypothetical protein
MVNRHHTCNSAVVVLPPRGAASTVPWSVRAPCCVGGASVNHVSISRARADLDFRLEKPTVKDQTLLKCLTLTT